MKRALLGLLVGCMALGLASAAMAGPNANAGISLHVTTPPVKATQCVNFAYDPGSNPFNLNGKPCNDKGTGLWDVWVVVCNANDSTGVSGAEFGIEYDGASGSGVDVLTWTSCADLQFPQHDWPLSGSGNLVTWEAVGNCQRNQLVADTPGTGYAVVGFFSVLAYGQDKMSVIPRPVSGAMKTADCINGEEDDITGAMVARGGIAQFCTGRKGYNYCRYTTLGTNETTWGRIKTQYGDN